MGNDRECLIGAFTIDDKCDVGELNGLKVQAELQVYEDVINYEDEEKTVGSCTIYVFDENDGNLFISADMHSQDLCDIISDTNIKKDDFEAFEVTNSMHLTWSEEKVNYFNGKSAKVAYIAGKVAILTDIDFEKEYSFTTNEMETFLLETIKKANKILNLDFFIAPDWFYIPEDIEDEVTIKRIKKENIQLLKRLGFTKTGLGSYILKL